MNKEEIEKLSEIGAEVIEPYLVKKLEEFLEDLVLFEGEVMAEQNFYNWGFALLTLHVSALNVLKKLITNVQKQTEEDWRKNGN
jgi:dephospho-CoA kinase